MSSESVTPRTVQQRTLARIVGNGRKHNARCEHSRKKKCKCACNGRYHGAEAFEHRVDPNDRPMSVEMGGEVAKFIQDLHGKTMTCWCGSELVCAGFMGYPHDNGLADKDGNKWWLYLNCDKCNYDWSFWKVERRAQPLVQEVKA